MTPGRTLNRVTRPAVKNQRNNDPLTYRLDIELHILPHVQIHGEEPHARTYGVHLETSAEQWPFRVHGNAFPGVVQGAEQSRELRFELFCIGRCDDHI